MKTFDIIIAGGGLVGATTALVLAKMGLEIALVEAVQPNLATSPSFDQRAVALSASSVAIFKSLGIWPKIQPLAESIQHIHVSDQGHFGFARLNASDYSVEALGEVIPLDQTGPLLWELINQRSNIQVYCPFDLVSIDEQENREDWIKVDIISRLCVSKQPTEYTETPVQISAKLLLGTDGTFSSVARLAGIESNRSDYNQYAVITNISTDLAHQNRAFERFTPNGPLALLPLTRNRLSLVWCQNKDNIDHIMQYDERQFIEQLQAAFGYRLGRINKVGQRFQYPLALQVAEKPYSKRLLLLGNSAHTLHPIAGQGFNIGLRDVAALCEHIEGTSMDNSRSKFDSGDSSNLLGSDEFLTNYVNSRKDDWRKTILATDSLVRIFSSDFLPLIFARDKALNLFDKIPLLKAQLANSAMGLSGHSAKLTRGLSLRNK
ncbi:MAG: 2-octaprenyl-6-methoxyphenyl hydroxylase [Kangiellaceae bacterium]|nr:2-octaprenyl-6-methoxyphenyl hydroxylase [Kangiellaceae bacterium]